LDIPIGVRPTTRFFGARCRAGSVRLRRCCALVVNGFVLVASAPVYAQGQRPVSYGVEVAFKSGHADRGYIISDRPVLQPVTWVSWNGAEFSAWGNVPLARNTDGTRSQIVELEVTREHEWGRITIGPAIRKWFYQEQPIPFRERPGKRRGQAARKPENYSAESMEGWLYVTYDAGPVRVFSNQSVDLTTYKWAYFGEAGIATERDITQTFGIGSQLGAGWASAMFNDAYFGIAKPALNRLSVEGWLTANITQRFYSRLQLDFNTTLDRNLHPGAKHPTYFLVALAVGVEF
jgi:hypothetical protein